MKMHVLSKIYNILTVLFAFLAIVSFSGITAGVPVLRVIFNILLFTYLSKTAYNAENKIIKQIEIKKKVKLKLNKTRQIKLNNVA